jgi:hypothetical protein
LFIVKFKVVVESQPFTLEVKNVYAPDVVYVVPFHVYESHAETVCVTNNALLIVKFNVAVESHPTAFVVEYVYAPDALYVVPFQV